MNIVLVGYSGVGKSTVGRILANRLSFKFIDIKEIIEQQEGNKIPFLVQTKGQSYVDRKEAELIAEVSCQENVIIATSSRSLLQEENFLCLQKNGCLIWLTAEPAIVLLRTCSSLKDRAVLLKSKDALQMIRSIMKERETGYQKAEYVVDTSDLPPEQVVEQILHYLRGKLT